jgi:CheY-like chemotaxis protein
MAGHAVLEASNINEALQCWEQHPVDLVVTSLDLPPNGGSALVAALHRRPDWKATPIVAVSDSTEQVRTFDFRSAGFQDCQVKFDTVADLESIARLLAYETCGDAVSAVQVEKR